MTLLERAEQAVLWGAPPIRALTVRQPFADAIIHGAKRTENRTQRAPRKSLGQTILIHAGKEPHASGVVAADFTHDKWPDTRGAIIGIAKLTGCHPESGDCCVPWGMTGCWHWELSDVTALAKPVPATGMLGLWTPPDDVLAAVQNQLVAGVDA
ncbi:ASCH domain-containing protein [Streptomyces hygroscopicus]|uniref:ASCH domain-containing protein n=1 Tax=Streptomyces hygroscopicus TaxID=1912 RepID=UPI0037BA61B4